MIEKVNDEINEYKSRADEANDAKLTKRRKLAQILFTIYNLYDKIHGINHTLIKRVSPYRDIQQDDVPKPPEGNLGEYDDFEHSTEYAKLMMN